jgi:hypothetical protein
MTEIKTRPMTKEYEEGWDKTFRKGQLSLIRKMPDGGKTVWKMVDGKLVEVKK